MRRVSTAVVSASLCVCALVFAACGSSDSSDDGPKGGGSATGETTAIESLDPALAGTVESWQALWTVYTPLLTYPHRAGTAGGDLVPGLAEALPKISDGGKTYTLKLRKGLKYSDGSAVKASDFEHTIKRILNLESIGSSLFFGIAGAGKYADGGKAQADLSGIETDDATGEITIELESPNGSFANVLASDYAGLVPGDTPFKNMSTDPPPGVGPYKLANVDLRRGFDLVKVPGFSVPGLQAGKLDKLTLTVYSSNRRATQDAIANKIDFMTHPPATDQITAVREKYAGARYKQLPVSAVYYLFLNEKLAPFKDRRVRQAVAFATDQRVIARLAAGLFGPACNFLPPDMAGRGYEQIEPCPYAPPDLAKARALVKQAGAEGTEVSVFGNDQAETKAIVEYFADVMNKIGLKAKTRILSGSAYYPYLSNHTKQVQAGFNSYGQDYPNPATFMFLVDGRLIADTANPNFGNVDDPAINKLIDKTAAVTDPTAAADDYAAIDKRIVEQAHVVPLGTRQLSVFLSERMNFDDCAVFHPVYNLDLTQLCLK